MKTGRPRRPQWIAKIFSQRMLVIAALLFQAAVGIYIIAGTSKHSQLIDLGLSLVSVGVCLFIYNRRNKPSFKLTWIFLIMLFPVFGGIFYLVFYTFSNPRKLRRRLRECDALARPHFRRRGDLLPALARSAHINQMRYLQEYAGFPVYARTRAEYFASGTAYFQRLLPELEKAERYIFLEFFILRQGKMLDPILDILYKKARAGVEVRLIYDDLGCFMSLPADFPRRLLEHGVKCRVFNPFKPILSSLQNNRDHRKIVVIDGKTAFTGGINLADEYINVFPKYGHWKDAAIMVEGDAAWAFTLFFLQMWRFISPEAPDDFNAFFPWGENEKDEREAESEGYFQPYADWPLDREDVGEHVYIQIINAARDYVYINTPYLVPGENLLSALALAAKSGVDVRIITPHRWDKWFVRIVSRSYYRQLVQAGVKVYEYSGGFNHSKTFVADDQMATVGTTNLDFRSLYLHFECGLFIYRSPAVLQVKEDFLATIPVSRQITLEDCSRKGTLWQDILRVFSRR